MASWVLVPCLVSLRDEFNVLSPGRDEASDGSIGDQKHAALSSDHNPDETGATPYEDADSKNEVHAIDVDKDLRKPGWTMERAVRIIVTRHRDGRDDRLQNVIFDRRIWSRSWYWLAREYTGPNPHDHHAHFSARYTVAQENNNTRPWGLLEGEGTVATLDADDRRYLENLLAPTTKALRAGLSGDAQIRDSMIELTRIGAREGVLDVLWMAAWARRHQVSIAAGGPGDPVYLDLLPEDQKRARNTLDLLQELGLTQLPDPIPGGTT